MKFERIYMQSGTNKKADSTDYIDYYKAENGAVIQIIELLNSSDRFYKVFGNENEMRQRKNPLFGSYSLCFQRLRDAKDYVAQMGVET